MLAAKRLAGVAPGVNEESIACTIQSTQERNPLWLWNSGQIQPEVQNSRVISGPKKTDGALWWGTLVRGIYISTV